MKSLKNRCLGWLMGLGCLVALATPAATVTWNNPAGGNWSVAGNWSPNQVPGSGDTALITLNGTYTVTVDATITVGSLTLGGASGQQTLATSGNSLTLSQASTANANSVVLLNGGLLVGPLTVSGQLNWTSGILGNANTGMNVAASGTLTLAGVNGTDYYLGEYLTNAGTIYLQSGNLNINWDTYWGNLINLPGGTVNIEANVNIDNLGNKLGFVNQGTVTKSAGTGATLINAIFTSSGTLNVQSGTMGLAGGGSLSGLLETAAGSSIYATNFAVTGALSSTGLLYWYGGTINNTGSLTVAPTGAVNLIGSATFQVAGPLTNNGTINWQGGGVVQIVNDNNNNYSGGIWNNAQFNNQTSAVVQHNQNTGYEIFHNAGTFTKNGDPGTTTFQTYLDNLGGAVVAQAGMINITDGSNLAGSFQAAAGAAITFTGGAYIWNGTANFSGNVQITGGTMAITARITSLAASGVSISGLSNIVSGVYLTNCTLVEAERIVGTVNLDGGTLDNGGSLTVVGGGILNLIGTGTLQLEGPLTNNGTINWQGGGALQIVNDNNNSYSGGIWNNAQFNNQTSAVLEHNQNTGYEIFHNAGTFTKNGDPGTTTFQTYLDNLGGAVVAQTGTINITDGSNLAGSFQAAAGAAITFGGGTYTWNGTANFSGNVQITAGTVAITARITSLAASGVTISGLSNIVSGVYLTNCTLVEAERIVGTVNWDGGVLDNGGSLTVVSGGILNLIGTGTFQLEGPLTNNGTINWQGGGSVQIVNDNNNSYSGAIWNNAQFNNQTSAVLQHNQNTGYEIFHNAGTFTKSGDPGSTTFQTYLDNLGGAVVAQTGTINITDGSNLAGSFQAAAGAAITFGGGTLTWNGTANFSGNVQITAGTVAITARITSLAASGVTISGLSNIVSGVYLTNCTLVDAERIVGTVNWDGGVLDNGGSLTVAGGGILNLVGTGTLQLEGPLTNNGTINWQGGGALQIVNDNNNSYSGGIWNNAQFNNQTSAVVQHNQNTGYEIFHNAGTFTKNGDAATTTFQTYLDNLGGAVVAQTGTINFTYGSNLAGSFQAAAGAAITFGGGMLTWNGTANFSGNVQITAGTVAITAQITSLAASGVTISGLSNIVSGAYLTNCTVLDAERIVGTVNLDGAQLDNGGSLTVAGSGVLNLIGTGTLTLEGPLTNNGTINWQGGGSVQIVNDNNNSYSGGIWNNAQFNNQTSAVVQHNQNTGYEVFHNAGTFTKNGDSATTTFQVDLVNTGTLDVETGTLSCTDGDTLGTGTALVFGLNSLTSYGSLNLAGAAALTGTVTAHLNGGYVPVAVGNSFPVVTYGSKTGSFNFTNLPAVAVWQPTYSATALSLEVVKLVPQITWANPANIVYGTALSSSQLKATFASPIVGGTNITGTFVYTPATGTILDSGSNQTLTVQFTPKDLTDFTNASGRVTINVLQAPLTLTANNHPKTYGQTVTFAGTEFTSSGLVNGDAVTSVTLASSGTPPTAPVSGSPYAISITNAVGDAGLTNYLITYVSGTLTVSPAPLTIAANSESKTYGQTVVFGNGSALFTPTGLQNGETVGSVTLAVSGSGGAPTAPVSGSPYTITPSAATGGSFAPGNYTIVYTTAHLTVNSAPLTVAATAESKSYGQIVTFGTGSARFTPTGLQNGETIGSVTLAVSGNGGAATATVAGSPYTITPSVATGGTFTAGNYTISYSTGLLTVNQASLTVTANAQSKTYGQTVTFGSGSTKFTPTGLQNSETIGTVTLAVSGSGGAATAAVSGSPYTITPGAATGGTFTAGNYSITYAAGNLTVNPAALTITASLESKTYGQTLALGSGSSLFTSSALQNGETVGSVTLTSGGGSPTASVAGSPYAITPSAATGGTFSPGNYTITYNPGNLTVTPAALTVIASAETKTYGQTVVFGAGDTLFTPTGLQNSETIGSVTLVVSGNGGAATATVAGSPYTITASAATGGTFTPGNYSITYATGTLTVTKAALTITANGQSKTYGQTVSFGSGSARFTPTGLQNSETIGTVTLAVSGSGGTATASVAGSPYTITPSAATGGTFTAGNYTITYAPSNLTVNPAGLTITANNQSKTYGQTLTFGSGSTLFTPAGLQNSETIGSVTLTSGGGVPTASVTGSPYAITPSAATGGTFNSANYAITYNPGNLTVNPAALTITASPESKTYGQPLNFGAGSTLFGNSGLQNGETIGSVTLSVSGNGGAPTAPVSGSPYTITPSAATGGTFTAGNYTITYATASLTVAKAALTITANAESKTYGQTVTFGSGSALFTPTGLQNGETIGSVTLAVSGNGGAATAPVVGSPYTITPGAATGGNFNPANYTITYTPGSLTVTPATLSVLASPESKTYGQTLTFGSGSTLFTPTGLQNGETIGSVTLAVSGNGGAPTATVAGSPYAITPGAATGGTFIAGNYTISYVPGNLTVSPAALTVQATTQSKTYGQALPFGSGSTQFKSSALQNGETIGSVTLSSSGGAPTAGVAGSPYTISPSSATGGTFNAGNYNISYVPANLTVNPAALTITADNTNKIAGQNLQFAGTEFAASGLQNAETIGTVTLTSTGTPAASKVGTYPIIPSAPTGGSFTTGNYTTSFANGTLTVVGAPSLTLAQSGNQYVLTFPTLLGQTYQVQTITNLAGTNWVAASGAIAGNNGIISVTNQITGPQAFFRLAIGTPVLSPRPTLTLAISGSQYVLSFTAHTGETYQLQTETNLAGPVWSDLGSPIAGSNTTVNVTNTIAAPQAFFRLETAP